MFSLWGRADMENLEKKKYEVFMEDAVGYKIRKWKYYLIEWCWKVIFSALGVFITVLLYNRCLFNPNCNTIVTIYFALLGLTCFFTQEYLWIN